MGCWNETCGLTQLSITEGTPVKYFILVAQEIKDPQATCYSTDWFSPITLPLTGNYNDYGSIEDIKEDLSFDLNRAILDCNSLPLDAIESGDLKPYSHVMVIESIYNEMTNWILSEKYVFYEETLREFLEEKIKLAQPEENYLILRDTLPKNYKLGKFRGITLANVLKYLDESKEDYLKFVAYNHLLEQMRRLWMPQTGRGSQDSNYLTQIKLNTLVNEYALEKENTDY